MLLSLPLRKNLELKSNSNLTSHIRNPINSNKYPKHRVLSLVTLRQRCPSSPLSSKMTNSLWPLCSKRKTPSPLWPLLPSSPKLQESLTLPWVWAVLNCSLLTLKSSRLTRLWCITHLNDSSSLKWRRRKRRSNGRRVMMRWSRETSSWVWKLNWVTWLSVGLWGRERVGMWRKWFTSRLKR